MPTPRVLLLAGILLTGCASATPTAGASPGAAVSSRATDSSSPSSAPSSAPSAGASPTVPPSPATPATPATPSTGRVCGSPTDHVYHVYRLHLIDACRTVTGVIAGIRSEADGDYHVRLTLDPQFVGMLRPANYSYQRGDLVLEPICQHTITQADALAPCAGGVAQIPIPPVGTHVSATGSYVLDEQHSGWAELHPLFEIHPA